MRQLFDTSILKKLIADLNFTMKLSLIIFLFVLFNCDVGIARTTDDEPVIPTQRIEEVDREWKIKDRENGESYLMNFLL